MKDSLKAKVSLSTRKWPPHVSPALMKLAIELAKSMREQDRIYDDMVSFKLATDQELEPMRELLLKSCELWGDVLIEIMELQKK